MKRTRRLRTGFLAISDVFLRSVFSALAGMPQVAVLEVATGGQKQLYFRLGRNPFGRKALLVNGDHRGMARTRFLLTRRGVRLRRTKCF
jgi:hypothetical protein